MMQTNPRKNLYTSKLTHESFRDHLELPLTSKTRDSVCLIIARCSIMFLQRNSSSRRHFL
jgi:hypothetical protein